MILFFPIQFCAFQFSSFHIPTGVVTGFFLLTFTNQSLTILPFLYVMQNKQQLYQLMLPRTFAFLFLPLR